MKERKECQRGMSSTEGEATGTRKEKEEEEEEEGNRWRRSRGDIRRRKERWRVARGTESGRWKEGKPLGRGGAGGGSKKKEKEEGRLAVILIG